MAVFALATAAVACTASVSPAPATVVVGSGTAIMDWTIQEAKDPAACQATGAATFHVALTGSGGFAGEFVQDCTAFATTISGLASDTYDGRAELLDSGGRARTTSVALTAFTVVGGASATVAVDFPANSFF
jgi:hypothetical protein